MNNRQCLTCGKPITQRKNEQDFAFKQRKHCDLYCYYNKPKIRINWKCRNCGMEKLVRPPFAKNRETCSYKCSVELFNKQNLRTKKIYGARYGYVVKPVIACMLLFFVSTVHATDIVLTYKITSKHAGKSLGFSATKTKKGESLAGVSSKTTKNNSVVAPTMTKVERFTPSSYVEELICKHFKNDCRTAVAVFKAESGLRANAQGWNCKYGDISAACKPEDRHLAWSVDCGIAQINFLGQECPTESFDPEWNIEKAYEWKYKSRGFEPWVAFTSGSYLRQL